MLYLIHNPDPSGNEPRKLEDAMSPADYFESLLENMNELLLVCDSGYRITLANSKASTLFGCARNDITGRKIFEFFSGENSQELQRKIEFFLKSGRAGGFEIPLQDKEGNKITLKAKVSPFTGDESSGGFMFLAQDISDLERAEADLKKVRERFHTSVEAIPDCFGIYRSVRDESGRIVDFLVEFVNAPTCSYHNLTKDQQVGRSLLELLPYHRELGLFDDFCRVVETGRPLMGEKLLYDDNNKHLIARALEIKTVRLDDGVAVYWRDITELKRTDEELRALTLVDDLTGLYNRRGFITLAQQQLKIARRMSRDMLLLFADVD
ncbi:MAG: PAS domain S-box protein, partial [Desulfocucumaceae bacterium]